MDKDKYKEDFLRSSYINNEPWRCREFCRDSGCEYHYGEIDQCMYGEDESSNDTIKQCLKSSGCHFCNHNHKDYTWENCIYQEESGSYTLTLESSSWDSYYDCYERTVLSDVKFCPKCGRYLK